MKHGLHRWVLAVLAVLCLPACDDAMDDTLKMLNVSYDPTRELYADINPLFRDYWRQKTGQDVAVKQSHGGSGTQARSVIDGLGADVVTLALAYDIDSIAAKTGRLPENWQSRLPNNSSPYTSTIVFLVRKGNPKGIKDWGDLAEDGIQVMTPNPQTSGGARWNYLAAWAWAEDRFSGDETRIKDYLRRLFHNVPILDTGARGSMTNFVKRGIGDVLIAWETEALFARNQFKDEGYEIIWPSVSIKAEPPATVVDRHAKRHKLLEAANGYLNFLYTPQAQEIIAKHYFRPSDTEVLERYREIFPPVIMRSIDADFGGWQVAQAKHFADGAIFDEISRRDVE